MARFCVWTPLVSFPPPACGKAKGNEHHLKNCFSLHPMIARGTIVVIEMNGGIE